MKDIKSLKEQCKAVIIHSPLYHHAVSPDSSLVEELKEELITEKANEEKKREAEQALMVNMVGIVNRGHGI